MTEYNSINAKLCNFELNKLNLTIKTATEVTLKLSSNMIRDSNDGSNFPHKLLLTERQLSKVRKDFANNSSANIKPKTQLPKIV